MKLGRGSALAGRGLGVFGERGSDFGDRGLQSVSAEMSIETLDFESAK